MPRVSVKKKEYKVSDLSKWIVAKMYEKKVRQEEMAGLIGISQPWFSCKLKKNQFTYGDLLTILKRLEATDEEIIKLMKL